MPTDRASFKPRATVASSRGTVAAQDVAQVDVLHAGAGGEAQGECEGRQDEGEGRDARRVGEAHENSFKVGCAR